MKDGHNKNSKGKLYAKYYNSMRTLKTSGQVPSKERVKTEVEIHTQRRHDIELVKYYFHFFPILLPFLLL